MCVHLIEQFCISQHHIKSSLCTQENKGNIILPPNLSPFLRNGGIKSGTGVRGFRVEWGTYLHLHAPSCQVTLKPQSVTHNVLHVTGSVLKMVDCTVYGGFDSNYFREGWRLGVKMHAECGALYCSPLWRLAEGVFTIGLLP